MKEIFQIKMKRIRITMMIIIMIMVILREIVREAIVGIEVHLTTAQEKRRDSSTTLRQQAATPIVTKDRIQKMRAMIPKAIQVAGIFRRDTASMEIDAHFLIKTD